MERMLRWDAERLSGSSQVLVSVPIHVRSIGIPKTVNLLAKRIASRQRYAKQDLALSFQQSLAIVALGIQRERLRDHIQRFRVATKFKMDVTQIEPAANVARINLNGAPITGLRIGIALL